jgi:hypothetical protein
MGVRRGLPQVSIRVGIATGEVVLQCGPTGNVGRTSHNGPTRSGIGTSHTPMLNAPPADRLAALLRARLQAHQPARCRRRPDDLRSAAEARAARHHAQIAPERMQARHQAVEGAMARLGDFSARGAARRADRRRRRPGRAVPSRQHARHSRLLRRDDPNVPLGPGSTRIGRWRATARWFEEKEPRDYPVDAALARI